MKGGKKKSKPSKSRVNLGEFGSGFSVSPCICEADVQDKIALTKPTQCQSGSHPRDPAKLTQCQTDDTKIGRFTLLSLHLRVCIRAGGAGYSRGCWSPCSKTTEDPKDGFD